MQKLPLFTLFGALTLLTACADDGAGGNTTTRGDADDVGSETGEQCEPSSIDVVIHGLQVGLEDPPDDQALLVNGGPDDQFIVIETADWSPGSAILAVMLSGNAGNPSSEIELRLMNGEWTDDSDGTNVTCITEGDPLGALKFNQLDNVNGIFSVDVSAVLPGSDFCLILDAGGNSPASVRVASSDLDACPLSE